MRCLLLVVQLSRTLSTGACRPLMLDMADLAAVQAVLSRQQVLLVVCSTQVCSLATHGLQLGRHTFLQTLRLSTSDA